MLCSAAMLNLAGACAFCGMTVLAGASQPAPWYAFALLMARFVDGLGTGIAVQFRLTATLHLFPSQQRASWMATQYLFTVLGIGAGPALTAAVDVSSSALGTSGASSLHCRVAFLYVGIVASCCFVVISSFPSLRDIQDRYLESEAGLGDGSQQPSGASTLYRHVDRRAICVCALLAMCALRAFVVSALESASAFILEEDYGWGVSNIGVTISCCYLSIIPLKAISNSFKDRWPLASWVQGFAVLALSGSLLILKRACFLPEPLGCASMLILADFIVFPSIYMSDTLSFGLLFKTSFILPERSWLAPNLVMIYSVVLANGVSRTIAPPAVRIAIHEQSQDAYAMVQAAAVVLYFALFKIFVADLAEADAALDEASRDPAIQTPVEESAPLPKEGRPWQAVASDGEDSSAECCHDFDEAGFAFKGDSYARSGLCNSLQIQSAIQGLVTDFTAGKVVCDIGAGDGSLSCKLSAACVVPVDLYPPCPPLWKCPIVVEDGLRYLCRSGDAGFDCVLFAFSEHYFETAALEKQLCRVLRRGGHALVFKVSPSSDFFGDPEFNRMFFSRRWCSSWGSSGVGAGGAMQCFCVRVPTRVQDLAAMLDARCWSNLVGMPQSEIDSMVRHIPENLTEVVITIDFSARRF